MKRLVLIGTTIALVGALAACGNDMFANDPAPEGQEGDTRVVRGDGPGSPGDPTAGRTGPLPDSGAASCVELYDPKTLTGRAFAFDGVVVDIGPSVSDRGDGADLRLPGVTFEVRAWFSGGRSDTVTVDMQPSGSVNSAGPEYGYGIGSRLLVSGEARWGGPSLEDAIAWGCGFTRYYEPETARVWHDAFTGSTGG